jgi:hypothetical protein
MGPVITAPTARATVTSYTFTKIADSTGPLESFGGPSINNSGQVTFMASYDNSANSGVFLGNGGPLATVADYTGPYGGFHNQPRIDGSGTVLFAAGLDAGGSGVFTRAGAAGPVTTVYSTPESFNTFLFNYHDISPTGTVAYADANAGIFTKTGAVTTTVVTANDPNYTLGGGGAVAVIGTANTVTFEAIHNGVQGIFAKTGAAPITTLIDQNDNHGFGFAFFNAGRIRADGTLIFNAALSNGHSGDFIRDPITGNIALVADDSGPFAHDLFNRPALNAAGQIALWARLDAGGMGIFNGPDPVLNDVIKTGDALFGSTLFDCDFAMGMNEAGDIAFNYSLANGQTGIAVAHPVPEPGALTFTALAAAAAAPARRRRRAIV